VFLALALLAATAAMLFSIYRAEPLREFLVAKRDLPSGVAITSANFSSLATDLDGEGLYLSSFEPAAVLANPLRKGQLLPVSSLGSPDSRYSVVLTPSQPISTSIRVGSLVDVWFVAKTGAGDSEGVPQRIGISLEVLSIARPEQGTAFVGEDTRLEVATSAEGLAPLMLASAEGGFIGVVTNQ
jgi:hypothetical protein